jgi:hypothetical protein
MPPDLLRANVLATFVTLPEVTKEQLTSSIQTKRERAEGSLATSIMVAVLQRRWCADHLQLSPKRRSFWLAS